MPSRIAFALLAALALAGCTGQAGSDPAVAAAASVAPGMRRLNAGDVALVIAVDRARTAASAGRHRQLGDLVNAATQGEAAAATASVDSTARALGLDPEAYHHARERIDQVIVEARDQRGREAAQFLRAAHREGLLAARTRAADDAARAAIDAVLVELEAADARDRASAPPADPAADAERELVARHAADLGITLLPPPEVEPAPLQSDATPEEASEAEVSVPADPAGTSGAAPPQAP